MLYNLGLSPANTNPGEAQGPLENMQRCMGFGEIINPNGSGRRLSLLSQIFVLNMGYVHVEGIGVQWCLVFSPSWPVKAFSQERCCCLALGILVSYRGWVGWGGSSHLEAVLPGVILPRTGLRIM